ncbi:4-Cys prefix domain-containing protein [Nostoc sp. NMS8]
MTYCINPHCPKPIDPVNANNVICRNCDTEGQKRVYQTSRC